MICKICASNLVQTDILFVKNIWNRDFGVCHCASCGGFFLSEVPDLTEIEAYYRNEYYKNVEGPIVSLAKGLFREFRSESQAAFISPFLKNKRRISVLEVGAGDGCLLSHFLPLAERVVGLEHSPKFLETAQMKFGIKLIDKNFFHIDESFDLILMSHVFEHFADIDRVAEHLRKILKPKGICFIEVPHSPNPSECSTEILEQYVNTTHMFNFTPLALSSFFDRKNFIVQKVARFFYRIPEGLDHRTQKAVGRLFLEGGGVTLETFFPAVRYVVTHIFDKKNSFKEVNLNGPFQGFGDNIRVVVSPKDDLQVR